MPDNRSINQDASPEEPSVSPLSPQEMDRIRDAVGAIRAALDRLPGDIAAETTSLLATVEGHLAASPPNAVATHEALGFIHDQLLSTNSKLAGQLADQVEPVLKMLGEPEALKPSIDTAGPN